jgi:hypothetical protein
VANATAPDPLLGHAFLELKTVLSSRTQGGQHDSPTDEGSAFAPGKPGQGGRVRPTCSFVSFCVTWASARALAAVALFILATDMFGLLTLTSRQSDATAIALSFVVGGMMFFAPLTLAVAVGRAGRRE